MLRRSEADRVLTGVAGGLGERLGIDPVVVRLAFIVLALAGGAGLVAYLALALVSAPPCPGAPTGAPRTGPRRLAAVALVVAGLLLLLREAGLWFGDGVVWPASLAVLGSAVLWTRGDAADRERWARLLVRLPRQAERVVSGGGGARAGVGALLIVGGLAAFFDSNRPLRLISNAPLAAAATAVGLAVILGPWAWRLLRQLAEERRERIRQEERAELAAHLHDSVLQTLALIQRADDPRVMRSLARVQERSLRDWLHGRGRAAGADVDRLSEAVDRAAAEVERVHGIRVELVVVGDAPLDEGLRALVDAVREAMVNAAKHSGASGVSVYVEVEPEEVAAYVRDQGSGFDPGSVPTDRRGIAESIEGRMRRNGGAAVVVSRPGRGTEVRLRIRRVRR